MEIDVEVVSPREVEDAGDLLHVVAVVAGCTANGRNVISTLDRLDQQSLGAGYAGHAFLEENTDLEIDGPSVIPGQRLDGLEPDEAAARIDLDVRAHPRRALEDRGLQRRLRASVDVLEGEMTLRLLDPLDGVGDVAARPQPP